MITFFRKLGRDPQLRNVDFRRFWLSSILTNFGAQITHLRRACSGCRRG